MATISLEPPQTFTTVAADLNIEEARGKSAVAGEGETAIARTIRNYYGPLGTIVDIRLIVVNQQTFVINGEKYFRAGIINADF